MTAQKLRFCVHNGDTSSASTKIQNASALADASPAYVPACHPEGKRSEKSVCYLAETACHTTCSDIHAG